MPRHAFNDLIRVAQIILSNLAHIQTYIFDLTDFSVDQQLR